MHHLITGGAGLIGSHVAEAVLGRGDQMTVIDELSTGSLRRFQHLKDPWATTEWDVVRERRASVTSERKERCQP